MLNLTVFICDIRTLWCSILSARVLECWNLKKMVGYTIIGAEHLNCNHIMTLDLTGLR